MLAALVSVILCAVYLFLNKRRYRVEVWYYVLAHCVAITAIVWLVQSFTDGAMLASIGVSALYFYYFGLRLSDKHKVAQSVIDGSIFTLIVLIAGTTRLCDMSEDDRYKPPRRTAADAAHAVARAGLSSIPYAGGAATELFSALVTPPLERRRHDWMERIGEGLRRLEQERKIKIEELRENESFIDTVMQASQASIRNSQAYKRQALRNAVLNAALPHPPDQALQHIFVDLVDTFTEWHIRILELFHNPGAWFDRHGVSNPSLGMGGLSHVLCAAFPELREQRPFYDQIWKDLYTRGLVNTEILHVTMSGQGLAQRRTSDMGAAFLAFITNPLSEGPNI